MRTVIKNAFELFSLRKENRKLMDDLVETNKSLELMLQQR
jgi:hypothetical protein